MNKQKGFTIIELLMVLMFIAVVAVVGTWGYNLVKLADCDFKPDYKCEVIHGVGVIPPFSLATVWFKDDR